MLRMHFLLALAAAAFLLAATALPPAISQAIAQPIFRCGNTYSQEACNGGKVVEDKTTTLQSSHSGSIVYLYVQRPWQRALLILRAQGKHNNFHDKSKYPA